MSSGKAPRFSVRQRGQVLTSASTVVSRVSKTMSTRTRRHGLPGRRPRGRARRPGTRSPGPSGRPGGSARPRRRGTSAPCPSGRARSRRVRPWSSCRPELREPFGVLFSHEHGHQQLEEHQQGVEQGAGLGAHPALRVQGLEASLEPRTRSAATPCSRRHRSLGLHRHDRGQHRQALPRGIAR